MSDNQIMPSNSLATLASQVRAGTMRTIEGMLMAGTALLAAKERLEHGQFVAWIEDECGLGYRSALNFMRAAERFGGKSEMVAHLPKGLVYELAAPAMPDMIVELVLASPEITLGTEDLRRLKDRYNAIPENLRQWIERQPDAHSRQLALIMALEMPGAILDILSYWDAQKAA